MKQILLSTLLICAINFGWSQDISQAKDLDLTSTLGEELASIIISNTQNFPNNTQLSIAIVDGDETSFIGIIRESDQLQMISNEEMVFEIGSISKVFGSILLSKQVNDNKLSLDDTMFSHMGFKNDKASEGSKKITLKMLSNHTSGLPRIPLNMFPVMVQDQDNPYKNYTVELLEDFYHSEVILDNEPGTTYAYSNLGAGTLGYILSKKAKMTFEELLQKEILQPLGMNASSSLMSKIDQERLVKGRNANGEITSNWDFSDAMAALGAIKSSVTDMAKFMRHNMQNDPAYDLAHKSTYSVNENLEVGLGWHISKEGERSVFWHNGGTGGYKSCMAIDKKGKKGIIVLSNVSAFGGNAQQIDGLCFQLLRNL